MAGMFKMGAGGPVGMSRMFGGASMSKATNSNNPMLLSVSFKDF